MLMHAFVVALTAHDASLERFQGPPAKHEFERIPREAHGTHWAHARDTRTTAI